MLLFCYMHWKQRMGSPKLYKIIGCSWYIHAWTYKYVDKCWISDSPHSVNLEVSVVKYWCCLSLWETPDEDRSIFSIWWFPESFVSPVKRDAFLSPWFQTFLYRYRCLSWQISSPSVSQVGLQSFMSNNTQWMSVYEEMKYRIDVNMITNKISAASL